MLKLISQINDWFKKIILPEVDSDFGGVPKYSKGFGSKRNPTDRIEKRINQQKKHSRWKSPF